MTTYNEALALNMRWVRHLNPDASDANVNAESHRVLRADEAQGLSAESLVDAQHRRLNTAREAAIAAESDRLAAELLAAGEVVRRGDLRGRAVDAAARAHPILFETVAEPTVLRSSTPTAPVHRTARTTTARADVATLSDEEKLTLAGAVARMALREFALRELPKGSSAKVHEAFLADLSPDEVTQIVASFAHRAKDPLELALIRDRLGIGKPNRQQRRAAASRGGR